MIDKISLYGFKSYVNQDFSLRPLTILTGLNSSGKSSVIQAVRILNNVTVFKNANKALYQLNIGNESEIRNPNCSKIKISATFDQEDTDNVSFDSEEGIKFISFPHLIYIYQHQEGEQPQLFHCLLILKLDLKARMF